MGVCVCVFVYTIYHDISAVGWKYAWGGPSRGLKTAPGLFLGGDLDGDWMLHVRSDLLDIHLAK